MSPLPFIKMHGLGNDFVVLDGRAGDLGIGAAAARAIADRHTGVGFDQLIILEPPQTDGADIFMRILNADGSEAGACGNATRCIADLILREAAGSEITIETISGLLPSARRPDGLVTVDMGPARTRWDEIPLARAMDTLEVPLGVPELGAACCTNMGNPHATFFVADADAIDLDRLGPQLEHHPLFPEAANIGVASLIGPDQLRLKVWERGAGFTLACGSGACAALVAASRRGITGRQAEIVMERGSLMLEWTANGHVLMTGPVATSFAGTLDPSLLGA